MSPPERFSRKEILNECGGTDGAPPNQEVHERHMVRRSPDWHFLRLGNNQVPLRIRYGERLCGEAGRPYIALISSFTAVAPTSCIGCAIVVMGGSVKVVAYWLS